MKILIILKKWTGGVGVVVKSIKKELEKRGHTVICISREKDFKCYSSVKNLFWLRRKYKDLIKVENPDIIYTQDWSMALPLLFPYSIYRKRHFTCFHGNQLGRTEFIQTMIGKLRGDKIIMVGDSLKKRFPKGTMIYNGVDLEKFTPLKEKGNCLGWINKGTEILTKKEILEISKKIGLKPLIAENFEIPFDKMNKEFYNECKVFISLPPKSAGFNLCWVEAMAAGVPIIIGNDEGIGWKLNINKVSSKKDLLNSFDKFNSKKKYREEIIKSDLTWKNHVDKLLDIWKK